MGWPYQQHPPMGWPIGWSNPITKGLVGCWLAGHGGNMAFDLSGNNNHGIFQNDTHLVSGKFGQAWDFDGTGDYIITTCGVGCVENVSAVSISLWFRNNNTSLLSDNYLFNIPGATAVMGAYRESANDCIYFRVYNDSGSNGLSKTDLAVADTNWHHLVGVYNGANVQLYVDISNKDSSPAALTGNTKTSPTQDFCISDSTNGWDGQIDNLLIFNRALIAEERQRLYIEPFCIFEEEPIDLWAGIGAPGAMTTNTGYWGPTV